MPYRKGEVQRKLLGAIEADDAEQLAGLLAMLTSAQKRAIFKSYNSNPLIEAARKGKINCLKVLLAQPETAPNIRVNYSGTDDVIFTALSLAARFGHPECVAELLIHPDINPNILVRQRYYPDDIHTSPTKTALMLTFWAASSKRSAEYTACATALLRDPRADVSINVNGYARECALIYWVGLDFDESIRKTIPREQRAAVVKTILARIDLDINQLVKAKLVEHLQFLQPDDPIAKELLKHPDMNPKATAEQLREHLEDVKQLLAEQIEFIAKLQGKAKERAEQALRSSLKKALAKANRNIKQFAKIPNDAARLEFYRAYRNLIIATMERLPEEPKVGIAHLLWHRSKPWRVAQDSETDVAPAPEPPPEKPKRGASQVSPE